MNALPQQDIETFILEYIREQLPDPDTPIDGGTDVVASRLLESFAILDLIMTLENRYGVKFTPRELADPRIGVIGNLARRIAEKATQHPG
jgi:acyl carrier protein